MIGRATSCAWLSALLLLLWASAAEGGGRSLVEVLSKHSDALKRESAALLLGLAGNQSAIPTLKRALHTDSSRWVRARAAEALGQLGRREPIAALKRALGREKDQAVRRAIAGALLRLGERSGLLELMWQLRSGRNHDRAEAMRRVVAATGQPLGQDVKRWWSYLAARGYAQLASRQARWRELAIAPVEAWPKGKRWRRLCVARLEVGPTRRPLTARLLKRAARRAGGLEDGCLIVIRTAWRQAARLPRRRPRRPGQSSQPADEAAPALTLDGLRWLLARAPKLQGVTLDGPRLDLPGPGRPVRDALRKAGRIGLSAVTAPAWLAARQRGALAIMLDAASSGEASRALLLVAQP